MRANKLTTLEKIVVTVWFGTLLPDRFTTLGRGTGLYMDQFRNYVYFVTEQITDTVTI